MRFIVMKQQRLQMFEVIDLVEGHRIGSWFYRIGEAEELANKLNSNS